MSETESATAAEGTKAPAETSSEATPSIEWIRDFAQRWIDACNSHEVDRLLALMSEDIEYRDDAWPKPMRAVMRLMGLSSCWSLPQGHPARLSKSFASSMSRHLMTGPQFSVG
jgi:hypothetical protein